MPRRSATAAVEGRQRQLRHFDAVKAADVDGGDVRAVRPLAAGKGFHTAGLAEEVVDHVVVELIVDQVRLGGNQLELPRRDEVPEHARLRADRAVAGQYRAEVTGHLVAYGAAMASA